MKDDEKTMSEKTTYSVDDFFADADRLADDDDRARAFERLLWLLDEQKHRSALRNADWRSAI